MKTLTVAAAQLAATSLHDRDADVVSTVARSAAQAAASAARLLVLPECTFPAYLLPDAGAYQEVVAARPELHPGAVLGSLSQAAMAHGLGIVAGLVLPQAMLDGLRSGGGAPFSGALAGGEATSGLLVNAAVVFHADGSVAGVSVKRLLWDSDRQLFVPGEPACVDVRLSDGRAVRLGVPICADMRCSRAVYRMVADGAQLLVSPAAWPGSSSDGVSVAAVQPDWLVAARAVELGVPVVAVSKCGHEGGLIRYAGRSCIVGGDGSELARASADRPELLVAELNLDGPSAVGRRSPAWLGSGYGGRIPATRFAWPGLGRPASGAFVAVLVPQTAMLERQIRDDMEPFLRSLAGLRAELLVVCPKQQEQGQAWRAPAAELAGGGPGVLAWPGDAVEQPARVVCMGWQLARHAGHLEAAVGGGAEVVAVLDAKWDQVGYLRLRAVEFGVSILGVGEDLAVVVGPDGRVVRNDVHVPSALVARVQPLGLSERVAGLFTPLAEIGT